MLLMFKLFVIKYDYETSRAGWDLEEDTPKTEQQVKEKKQQRLDLIWVISVSLGSSYFIIVLIARLFGAHL